MVEKRSQNISFPSEQDRERLGSILAWCEDREINVSGYMRKAVFDRAEKEGVFNGRSKKQAARKSP